MNILFIGDVVGKPGREVVKYFIDYLNDQMGLDFVIANLENASHGKGLIRSHCLEMLDAGVDVVTLGNHYLSKKEINEYIDDYDQLIRPYNVHSSMKGRGTGVFECDGIKIRVTNLLGRVYLADTNNNPFDALEEIVKKDESDIHIVDFHAEATGEKLALAWAFDGKVDAIFGTHTHVQTNDLRTLKNGTVYCSDVGMCGPYNGILGASKEEVIKRTWTGAPSIFNVQEDDEYVFSAISLVIDEESKKIVEFNNIYTVIHRSEIYG